VIAAPFLAFQPFFPLLDKLSQGALFKHRLHIKIMRLALSTQITYFKMSLSVKKTCDERFKEQQKI
jgi:hypothetical protein